MPSKAPVKQVTLTIDDLEITVPDGTTVLDAAKSAGIYIPYLCAHPVLRPWGACRMCTVEIEKARGIPTACTSPVGEGMVVRTNTPTVQGLRRNVMELILSEHPIGCLSCHKRDQCGPQETCLRSYAVDFRCVTCPANYRCELQLNADYVGLDEIAMPVRQKNIPLRKDPLIALDWNLCIVCGRCVRVCDEVRVIGVYGMVEKSGATMIDTAFGSSLEDAGCIFCGACVDVCPVGAIEERRNRFAGVSDSVAESVCQYCSDGCGFRLEQKREQVIRIQPIWDSPTNGGMYCVKGRFGTAEPIAHPSRLQTPLIRENGQLRPASWHEVLDRVETEFKNHGDRVAVIGSVRTTNEASYLLQKLARHAIKTPHIDTTARLSDVSGLIGMRQVLGVGASTASHEVIRDTDLILMVGANLSHLSPITGMKVKQASRRQVKVAPNTGYFSYLPETGVRERDRAKLVVIDPRETDFAVDADIWLRPTPGTDQQLLTAMLHVFLSENLVTEDSLANFDGVDALLESLIGFDLNDAASVTGISVDDIIGAARAIAAAPTAITIFGRGLTQQKNGTATVATLAAFAAVSSHLYGDGNGVLFPVAANNTRGAFDLGLTPEFGPGYTPVDAGGLRLLDQLEALERGELSAAYIVGANPAKSAPDSAQVRRALETASFVVVQDMYLTETAALADVVLPAASFAEQDGTTTSADRLVQRIRRSTEPKGESKPDWRIIAEIGQRLGDGFNFVHPLEIFDEIASVSPIHRNMTYDLFDDAAIAWPVESDPGFLERPNVAPLEVVAATELSSAFPVRLEQTSSFIHFGTGVQTRLVKQFSHFQAYELVEIGHHDAEGLGVETGDFVRIVTANGQATVRASVQHDIPAGNVAVTNVFPDSQVGTLFGRHADVISGTPAVKSECARLEKA